MNSTQKQTLKRLAHHLKPVILIGAKGFSEALVKETDAALQAHELIKVKLTGLEKDEKIPFIELLCVQTQAELVQLLGHIAIIYRKRRV